MEITLFFVGIDKEDAWFNGADNHCLDSFDSAYDLAQTIPNGKVYSLTTQVHYSDLKRETDV